jgi:tripartite-type tricarboxylate transporter receptor subunit TctC
MQPQNMLKRAAFTAAAIALFVAGIAQTQAQEFPTKPIRIVVGQGAGGGMDTLARLIGQKLAIDLGQPVLIENKVGAGGIIGTEFVAKAANDGHTLLMGPIGNMVFTPLLVPKLRYSATKDFVPISLVATFPLMLVVNAKQPFQNVAELVAYMKANPAKSNYGGSGPAFQFASELFRLNSGAAGEFIQYKSMSETLTALVAGDLIMSMVDTGPAIPMIADGRIRALAVTSSKRLAAFPNVPTMAEMGFPQIEFRYWAGLFAPAGTPASVVTKLETEIGRIVKLPDVMAKMNAIQITPAASSSEELSKILSNDLMLWGAVAEKAKIKLAE